MATTNIVVADELTAVAAGGVVIVFFDSILIVIISVFGGSFGIILAGSHVAVLGYPVFICIIIIAILTVIAVFYVALRLEFLSLMVLQ